MSKDPSSEDRDPVERLAEEFVARHELLGQPLHRVTIFTGRILGHGPYLTLGRGSFLRGPVGRGRWPGSPAAAPGRGYSGCSPPSWSEPALGPPRRCSAPRSGAASTPRGRAAPSC